MKTTRSRRVFLSNENEHLFRMVVKLMCDICDYDLDFGHYEGCPLDGRYGYGTLSCSVCGEQIRQGQHYIYNPDGHGDGFVCSDCIESFSVTEILDVCGISSVTEIISELSDKLMKASEPY